MSHAYRLAYSDGWIYCVGKDALLKVLIRMPGAAKLNTQDGTPCIAIPANRAAFMTAEALAAPVSVTKEYSDAREEVMGYTGPELEAIQRALDAPGNFKRKLLPHQLAACRFTLNRRGIINASEQGTGKTTYGWAMAYLWQAKRTLIICPKSLMGTWRSEWDALWNGTKPMGLALFDEGTKSQRRERLRYQGMIARDSHPATCVVNYEVAADMEKAILTYRPDCVILDESFRVKNHEAKSTQAITTICDQAAHVLLLTGTPVGNNGVADLYSQLRMLGADLVPDTYWSFVARFSVMEQKNIGVRTVSKPVGLADPVGLMQLLEPVWFRATKETCLQLPPKQHHIVKLPLHPEVQAWYDAVEKDGECVLGNVLSLSSNRVVNIRLHQICGGHLPQFAQGERPDEEPLKDSGVNDPTLLANSTYRMVPVPCNKVEWLREFAEDRLKDTPSARAIVWVRYNTERARIFSELGGLLGETRVAEVWGATKNNELEKIKESFNSRDEDGVQVIVAQVKKMAFGHNLQAADSHIFFSNDWSYVTRVQAEDRSHRMGREGGIDYYDLLIDSTVDEDIKEALDKHSDFADRVARGTV